MSPFARSGRISVQKGETNSKITATTLSCCVAFASKSVVLQLRKEGRAHAMGPNRSPLGHPHRLTMRSMLVWATLISRGASKALLSRSAIKMSGSPRIQPGSSSGIARTRVAVPSAGAMALGRNSSRSRPAPAKQGRRGRGGCGGTPGGSSTRPGRDGTRAKGRRSSFGEERSGQIGFWEAGDVIWGNGGGGGSGGGRQGGRKRPSVSKGEGEFGKQYHPHRAGGTFSAKGELSVVPRRRKIGSDHHTHPLLAKTHALALPLLLLVALRVQVRFDDLSAADCHISSTPPRRRVLLHE